MLSVTVKQNETEVNFLRFCHVWPKFKKFITFADDKSQMPISHARHSNTTVVNIHAQPLFCLLSLQ